MPNDSNSSNALVSVSPLDLGASLHTVPQREPVSCGCLPCDLLLPYWKPASQVVLVVKNPPASAGEVRDVGSIPGSGRSPGEGSGNPLQHSCLENPMSRGAW